MATSTITLRVPEAEKRAANRILRAHGTTLARRLRAFVREIIAEEDVAVSPLDPVEDADIIPVVRKRLANLDLKHCTPLEDFVAELERERSKK